jgi:hypothetical protein
VAAVRITAGFADAIATRGINDAVTAQIVHRAAARIAKMEIFLGVTILGLMVWLANRRQIAEMLARSRSRERRRAELYAKSALAKKNKQHEADGRRSVECVEMRPDGD